MPNPEESIGPIKKQRLTRCTSSTCPQTALSPPASSQSGHGIERVPSANVTAFVRSQSHHGMITRTMSAEMTMQFNALRFPTNERDNVPVHSLPRTSSGSSSRARNSQIIKQDSKQKTLHETEQPGLTARCFHHSSAPSAPTAATVVAPRKRLEVDGFLVERRLQQGREALTRKQNRKRLQSDY